MLKRGVTNAEDEVSLPNTKLDNCSAYFRHLMWLEDKLGFFRNFFKNFQSYQ
jgi:hypothetical protein